MKSTKQCDILKIEQKSAYKMNKSTEENKITKMVEKPVVPRNSDVVDNTRGLISKPWKEDYEKQRKAASKSQTKGRDVGSQGYVWNQRSNTVWSSQGNY